MLNLENQGHPSAVTDAHNVFLPPPYLVRGCERLASSVRIERSDSCRDRDRYADAHGVLNTRMIRVIGSNLDVMLRTESDGKWKDKIQR